MLTLGMGRMHGWPVAFPTMNKTLIASLCMVLLSACAKTVEAPPPSAAHERRAKVQIAMPSAQRLELSWKGSGKLIADRAAELVTEVSGIVEQVLVEEGDAVKAGQVLMVLDSERSALEVRRLQAELNKLEGEHKRLVKLGAQSLVSRDQIEAASFDLAARRAALDLAQLTVAKASIRAPFAGVITSRMVKLGHNLKSMQPVVAIADLESLRLELNLPEREAAAVHEGMAAEVVIDALGGSAFKARVDRVRPVVDRASGTVVALLAIDAGNVQLRPGLFARASIVLGEVENALMVPRTAVDRQGDGQIVYVVDAGSARARSVQTGEMHDGLLRIVAGLDADQAVIVSGLSGLRDGDQVEVIDASPSLSAR